VLSVNGRGYQLPGRPTVVVCLDGWDPAYIAAGLGAGVLPTVARMRSEGFSADALCALPAFTNPNNIAIVTGVPASINGVSGNFYLDRATGAKVMVTGDRELRVPTILAAMAEAGVPVAVITAKDKLLASLGKGLSPAHGSIVASAERADRATSATHGIDDLPGFVGAPVPDAYSAELSLFVLDAGVALLSAGRARLLYLSLSDYMMHGHAPEAPEALAFCAAVDRRLGELVALGAVVGATADHGMTDMARPDGTPNVLFLGDALDARFGAGAAEVICPITDPYVRHHGALGSFARVHLAPGARIDVAEAIAFLAALPGVEIALPGPEACARFDLAPEMEGDVTVLGAAGVALGARAVDHDLSQLAGARLRSHGGLHEQAVPFLVSAPLSGAWRAAHPTLRNYDIFDAVLNGPARP
jgi:phosphonoacetate hydrolase